MFRKRMWYAIVAILVVVTLLAGCVTRDCGECVQTQGLSHMTGPIDLTGAGTAAAPAFYLNGDSDTGIYQPAANQWGVAIAGAQVLGVSASGPAWTGAGFDVNVTGAASIDADLASNFNTAAGDITLEAEVASVTLKGDEGAADAVHLDADQTAGGGVTIAANTGGVDVNLTATGPFAIDGDMLVVGNAGADGDVADADNDMLVVGVLEVDGELECDGTADFDAAMTAMTMTIGTDGVGQDVTFNSLTAGDALLWDASDVALEITGTSAQNALEIAEGDLTVTLGDMAVSAGAFDVTAGATTVETMTIGTDGVGADVTFHSLTASDAMLWDASDVALEITGTSAQNALEVAEGDLAVTLGDVTIAAGAFDVTAGATTVETTTIGVDGTGADVTFHSLTASDAMLWDASDVALEITGTSAQNALEVVEGNLAVSLGTFDVTVGATTVETMTVGVSGTGADVIFHSLTGGDELTWDASAEALLIEGTDGQTSLDIVDGNLALADDFVLGTGATISVTNATGHGAVFVSEATFTQAISETATTMFVIPANVNIVDVMFVVATQWDDGASAVVDCGISGGDLDAYVDNHDINDAADLNRTGDNADMPFASALGDVGGSDITVVCQVALGTGDQTAGSATIRIWWAID